MPQKRRRQSRRRWIPISQNRKKEIRTAYLFLLPSLLGVGGFVFLPFLDVIRRSFLQASGKGFVGARNYQSVLLNEAFGRAAGNTARFMVICIPLLLYYHCARHWRFGIPVCFKKRQRPVCFCLWLCPWRLWQSVSR